MVHLLMNPWPPDDGSDAAYDTEAAHAGDPVSPAGAGDLPVPDVPVTCPGRPAGHYLVPTSDGGGFCAFCSAWWPPLLDYRTALADGAAGGGARTEETAAPSLTIIQGIWGEDLP